MEEILTYGQILTIFTVSIMMVQISWMIELIELFEDFIDKKFYKNWHLFCSLQKKSSTIRIFQGHTDFDMAKSLKKVLIVDDEETLTWSMSKSLSKDRDKYEVTIANNGQEALGHLRNEKIDLVITDIRMPDINGLDLLVKIKKEYPETKVIIMTAYGSSDVQKEANRRGSLYYVEKPFEISDIRKIIIDLVGRKKGFRGKLFGLQLTDIIQMNCLGRLTTALIITRDGEKGVIYLNEGEIIHAECGEQKGTEAFYSILSWQEGEFVSNIGFVPPMQTIYQNWEHLLIEAMRRTDERQ